MNARKRILSLFVIFTLTVLDIPLSTSHAQDTASTVFAVVGDYGEYLLPYEGEVASRIKSWNPDFIVTAGDNNYPAGAAATIDPNIGRYYSDYIYPYTGSYGTGAATNRFFPALGNHDWETDPPQPYLDYFTLPGNERYYDFVWGPVRIFILDSDPHEPDGELSVSTQGVWLQNRLEESSEQWKLVVCHHPPYSSGTRHGSTPYMQWPFQEWGATAVISGHDHGYERIVRDGFPYFVDGLGGQSKYDYSFTDPPVSGSEVRYNSDYGAMRVEATDTDITFQFISQGGIIVDTYTSMLSPTPMANTPTPVAITPTPTATSTPIIDLIPNKTTFSSTDRIEVMANVQPISTPCYPFIRFLLPDGSILYFQGEGSSPGLKTSPTPYFGLPLQAVTVPSAIVGYPALSAGFEGIAPGTYIMEGGAVDATQTISVNNLIYVDGIDREMLIVQ